MANKYHKRQGFRGAGAVLSKVFAKTAPERKDQLLEAIKKTRNKNLPEKFRDKKFKMFGKEFKSDKYTMDVDTYTDVTNMMDAEVKKKLKAFGFKEKK